MTREAPSDGQILRAIGGTPLVALRRIVPRNGARILVKLESHNPTGSMKDRMALSVIEHGVASGALSGRGEVVEYTGGSTGTSLALVCAARGIPITLVSSDAFSREKRDHMRALGATLIEIPSHGGGTTRELIQAMMARAAELAAEPGWYYADQFRNPAAAAGYAPLAGELWEQSGGRIDAFVQSVGTAQCMTGVARVLRTKLPDVRIVAVEPAESAVLSGGAPGAHHIEGVGPGFVPPMWEDGLADGIETVSTDEAQRMARRLAREEAVFAGTSAGANVVAALRVAERLSPAATVVTLICDSGLKYLSTDLYSAAPRAADPVPSRPDPLHGQTLEKILHRLVDHYGWEELGRRINIQCFRNDPSVSSSLKFLRKTPWARAKVEKLFVRLPRSRGKGGEA